MKERRIQIALTIGDPAGIGPEITADLLDARIDFGADIALIGSADAMTAAARKAGAPLPRVIGTGAAVTGGALFDSPAAGAPVIVDTGEGRDVPAGIHEGRVPRAGLFRARRSRRQPGLPPEDSSTA